MQKQKIIEKLERLKGEIANFPLTTHEQKIWEVLGIDLSIERIKEMK